MINKFIKYLKSLRYMQRVNLSLSRGAASSSLRSIDLKNPTTWEFSGFSQNGEDGILDILTRHILNPNYYFIEIGASDALENNTTWLALAKRYSGIWVDGDKKSLNLCEHVFTSLNYGLEIICMFITKHNIKELLKKSLFKNPDVFSLDVDGNDYYLANEILEENFRPKIFIVEYNSAFGPDLSVTIPYQENFIINRDKNHNLYYGCSIAAWRKLFSKYGYSFVTVDRNGVNAIFIDSQELLHDFVRGVSGINFAENFAQLREYKVSWRGQFSIIGDKEIISI